MAKPPLFTIILMAAGSVITLNLFMPALADIADDFGVRQSLISWAFSGYMLVTAFVQLIIGPLSDRYGRRPVALGCFGIFAVASLVAALAPNALVFFIGRFVQAAVVGGAVLTQAIVRETSKDQNDTAGTLATVTMIMAVAPMAAPLIGGFLSDALGWRSNFWFLGGYGVLLVVLIWWTLFETNQNPSKTFGTQFRAYPQLFTSTKFWGYALSNSFAVGMFYAFLVAMPLVGRAQFDLSNSLIGLSMAALPVGYFTGNALVRWKSKALGIAWFIWTGRLLGIAAPLLTLAFIWLGFSGLWIYAPLVLVGTANAFTVPTANAGAVSINTKIAGSAAGLLASQTLLLGTIIAALTGWLVEFSPRIDTMLWIMAAVAILGLWPSYSIWRDRNV